jgi:three-Cys-motif partner protein
MAVPRDIVWECKPHTLAKHRIVEAYLNAWYPILIGQPWCKTLTYAEGFSGAGTYVGGNPGSPVIAAEIFLRRKHLAAGKTVNMVLVEEHPERLARLKKEIATPFQKYGLQDGPLVSYEEGECGEKLLPALSQSGAWKGPIFAFLDSYGGPDVPFDVARAIGKNRSGEVLVTFGTNFLTRFGSRGEYQTAGDQAFGGQTWRKVYELPGAEKKSFLVDAYRNSLNAAGFTYVLSFEMIDDTGSDLHLVFGTKDPLGLERMKDAMWHIDPVRGVRYRDPRMPDQATFELDMHPHLEPLCLEILRVLGDRPQTVEELQRHTLLETVYRPPHATNAVKDLAMRALVERSAGRLTRATSVRATPEGRRRLAEATLPKNDPIAVPRTRADTHTGPVESESDRLF